MRVQELFNLKDRTALVTGGSRGLGLQIAEALGEAGARIVITSRKQSDLQIAVSHLNDRGLDAVPIACDLAHADSIPELVEGALLQLSHIDILVNNAGATWGAPAEDYPLEAWDKVMNLNIRSVFLLTQAVGKRSMIPRRCGRIINIASIAGLRGNWPGLMETVAYNTSKGAVVNFTRTLAAEWGEFGITVNTIAPYIFPTRMTRSLISQHDDAAMVGHVPLRRLGGDDDLKGASVLFASDAGKYITGQILAVDGGFSAV